MTENVSNASPRSQRGRWIQLTLALVILAGLLALSLRTLEFDKVKDAMLAASGRWPLGVAASSLALLVCMTACSLRLWLLTVPLPLPAGRQHLGIGDMLSVYLASSAAHHLLPAPAAEVLRTVYLRRRWGYTIGGLVASQLVDKLIDALGLGIEVAVIALVVPHQLPKSLHTGLLLFAGIVLGGIVVLVFLGMRHGARHHRPGAPAVDPATLGRLGGFVFTLGEGMYLLGRWRLWLPSLACSLVNDVANASTLALVTIAVGVHFEPAAWPAAMMVAMVASRLAGLLPSTPGQFGVVEAAVAGALMTCGVEKNQAAAIGVLYHLVHFVPVTLVGVFELRRHWGPRAAATAKA